MKKSKKRYWMILVIFVLFGIWVAWSNTALELNEYEIKCEQLPETFDGFRIVQISDLHNAKMGEENSKLLKMIENAKPDIIVITGDIIDSYHTNVDVSLQFVEKAVDIAPCYFITGNHEAWIPEAEYMRLENALLEEGVYVLHDEDVLLERDGESISLVAMDDPSFNENYDGVRYNMTSEAIKSIVSNEGFHILLSHRPEFFETYVEADIDLVLSGHAHGGQFRLPFIGGIVAPNQGFFPEYDAGVFEEGNTSMIVSRGIGNSIIPIRFNNRPEVVVVCLKR